MPSSNLYDFRETSKRLISIRTKNGLTQQQLANKSGISLQTVKNYEKAGSNNISDPDNGDRINAISGMKIETLFKIAQSLNVSSDYLIGLTDIPSLDLSVQEIHRKTGLTEENISTMINRGPFGGENNPYMIDGYKQLTNDLITYASTHNAARTYSHFLNEVNGPLPPNPQHSSEGTPAIVQLRVVADVISGFPEDGVDYAVGYEVIDPIVYSRFLLDEFLHDLKVYLHELYFESDDEEIGIR